MLADPLPHLHGCKAHRHPKAEHGHVGVGEDHNRVGWRPLDRLGMYQGGDHHYMTPNPKNAEKEGKSHQNYHTCFALFLI